MDPLTLFLDQKWALDNHGKRSELEEMLLSPLYKYRFKLLENYEDQELGEHKITMVGKKYHKNQAVIQMDFVIFKIQEVFQKVPFEGMNPEEVENWHKIPKIIIELFLQNSFLFDLLKSEIFDWEINHHRYKDMEGFDFCLGIFSALL